MHFLLFIQVLEERKAGTIKILSQIGQDTAITEQQIRIVKAQMEKIQRLKKVKLWLLV